MEDPKFVYKSDTDTDIKLESLLPSSPFHQKRRWFVLLSFFVLSVINGFGWGTYSAIITPTGQYYSVSSSTILWFTWEYYFTYVLFSFPASNLLGKNLSLTLIAAGVLTAAGGWVRYVAFGRWIFALLGQILISLATNMILPAPNVIGNMWFGEKERFLSVTTGVVANSLGVGLGIVFSPIIVGSDHELITRLNFIEAIVLTVPLILCVLFVRNNEKLKKSSENVSTNATNSVKKLSFWQSLKVLFKNYKYMLAVLGFGINNGNCWNMLGIIDIFLKDDDMSSIMVGVMGLLFILSAIIGSFVGTFFLKFKRNSQKYFDPILKTLYVISVLSFTAVSIIVPLKKYLALLIITIIFLGLGALGLQPFACEALEKLGKPIHESITVNGLFFLTCLLGFPISFIATLPVFGDYGLWTLAISVMPFTVYLLGWYKTPFEENCEKVTV